MECEPDLVLVLWFVLQKHKNKIMNYYFHNFLCFCTAGAGMMWLNPNKKKTWVYEKKNTNNNQKKLQHKKHLQIFNKTYMK